MPEAAGGAFAVQGDRDYSEYAGSEWMLGAAINLCGNVLINLGTNLVKLGHNQERESRRLGPSDRVGPICCPGRPCALRLGGWSLFAFGSAMNFASFSLAAQSLLAALGAVQFISNGLFAKYCLGEPVTRRMMQATIGIVCGICFVVFSASHENRVYSVRELQLLYAEPAYLMYLALSLAAGAAAHVGYNNLLLKNMTGQGAEIDLEALPGQGQPATPTGKGLKPKAQQRAGHAYSFYSIPPVERTLLCLLFAISSAAVGTQSVLMAKSVALVLRLELAGHSQLRSPFPVCLLLMFGFSAAFWMTRLNRGLRLFPSLYIVPMMQAMWTLMSIMNGGIYFHEFATFSAQDHAFFFGGVVLVLSSVLSLAPQANSSDAMGGTPRSRGWRGENGSCEESRGLLVDTHRNLDDTMVDGISEANSTGSCIFSLPCVPFLFSAVEAAPVSEERRHLALQQEHSLALASRSSIAVVCERSPPSARQKITKTVKGQNIDNANSEHQSPRRRGFWYWRVSDATSTQANEPIDVIERA